MTEHSPLLFSVETGRELGEEKPLEQSQDPRFEHSIPCHSLLFSACGRNERVSPSAGDADVTSLLASYLVPFSTYFRYLYVGGEIKTYFRRTLLPRKVTYTTCDVDRFVE
jgi:hypothetical protein